MPDIYVSEQRTKNKERRKEKEQLTQQLRPEDEQPLAGTTHDVKGHTHNPLAALNVRPDSVHFETQDKEEKIVLLLRRHPITNIPWISLATLMILAPALLRLFPLLSFLPLRFQLIGILIWYLVILAFVLEEFLTWFFNVYIATDERIVDIDFFNLIYKEVSDTKIDKIQDVTYKMGGVVRTIFNYGDVFIQTAAEVPNFEFSAVPNPARVARILQELRVEEEKEALEGRIR